MSDEQWKPIQGFPHFEVSNLGRVRSWRKRGPWTEERADQPRILKATDTSGYPRVKVSNAQQTVIRRIHRLVLDAFVGPCPPGMECAHLNGIPSDNRLENLRWCTPAENYADRIRQGVVPGIVGTEQLHVTKGRPSYNFKLTDLYDSSMRLLLPHDGVDPRRASEEGVELWASLGASPYFVSNMGRVRFARAGYSVDIEPCLSQNKYPIVSLRGVGSHLYLSRLVISVFEGDSPQIVYRVNGKPDDNRLCNLVRKPWTRGRLSPQTLEALQARLREGIEPAAIANELGISPSHVHYYRRRRERRLLDFRVSP